MTRVASAKHVVVDGSNIATEGRSKPSLAQLNEAVTTFMADHDGVVITVVVDATFGHRIDPSERSVFDEAVANNELVAPPAGAVGRGDAFVLNIADRAKATVLSNDSFQEFHGNFPWLFDEGRLIGGKPVPHVGWVFVERTPVRGPVSRRATQDSKAKPSKVSARANDPMPIPKSPPPGATAPSKSKSDAKKSPAAKPRKSTMLGATTAPKEAAATSNDLLPFLDFVGSNPVGSTCRGTIERYASHGAYAKVGDVSVYIPLRLMSDPPPKSARSKVKIGDEVQVRIEAFVAARRSVDASLLTDVGSAAGADETPVSSIEDTAKATPRVLKRAATKATAKRSVPTQVAKKVSKKSVSATPRTKSVAKAVMPTKAASKKSAAKATAGSKKASSTEAKRPKQTTKPSPTSEGLAKSSPRRKAVS